MTPTCPRSGYACPIQGTKAWFLMTRVDSKLTRITLGRYPALSLAEARDKARHLLERAKAGDDPRKMEAEERHRKIRERHNTFEKVAALFMDHYVDRKLRPNTAREYRRILQGRDTQQWRLRPITSLGKVDVLELIQRIEARGSPAAANRSLAYISKFFNWCAEEELITTNPAGRISAVSANSSRDRVLTEDELPCIRTALQSFSWPFGPLFRLLLLTGQRRSEVAGMRWDELRGMGTPAALWDLPAHRTKSGQPHLVPLSPAVHDLLSAMGPRGPWVFSTTGQTVVSEFSRAKRMLNSQIAEMRNAKNLASLPPWTLHDLRRTMVTTMNERLGIQPHVVEAIVNHTSGAAKRGVAGVYNRALYLDDRRDALRAWESYVLGLREERENAFLHL